MTLHGSVLKGLKLKVKKRTSLKEEPPSLIQIVEHHALQQMRPREPFFRPSMLFGCDRENIFHYQDVRQSPNQIGPQLLRVLDNGTAVHSLIQDSYLSVHPDYWFVKEPKVRVKVGGAVIKGSSDGTMIRRSDMYRWGIEIKTINHTDFMRLNGPHEDHVFQASLYMHMQGLSWITILYWDKDKHHLREYHVQKNKTAWDEVVERVTELKQYVDEGKLPRYDKRTCNKTFCRYVAHCRKKGAPV